MLARNSFSTIEAPTRSRRASILSFGAVLGCLLAVSLATDLVRDHLLRASGYAISLVPSRRRVSVDSGQKARVSVMARNLLPRSVAIEGMSADCICLSSTSFPRVIPASGEMALDFEVTARRSRNTSNVRLAARVDAIR